MAAHDLSKGRTTISHFFVMDWASLWLDIAGGLLIAGALAAWVPKGFWQAFFLQGHPIVARLWGPVVGPIVAILSFVCSVGNVPLAAVLWNGGISFGGVVAFSFRRPHCASNSRYLPQILWVEDQRVPAGYFLCFHVFGSPGSRIYLRSTSPHPTGATCTYC
jgi:hypothetical protein